MQQQHRRTVFGIFAIFFLVTTPFLLIYSLGFNFNFDKQELTSTLAVNVETLPRSAEIKVDRSIFYSPTEIKINAGQTLDLEVQKKDYISEKFLLSTTQNLSSVVKINNLALLPKESSLIGKAEGKIISFLGDSYLLIQSNNTYYIQLFSYGGIQGKKEILNLKADQKVNLETTWESLSDNVFWDKGNLVIYKKNNGWSIQDFKDFNLDIYSVVENSDKQILLLDANGKLWLFDMVAEKLDFLDSGFRGLNAKVETDSIWLWKKDKLLRLNRGSINPLEFNLQGNIYFEYFAKYNDPEKIFRFQDFIVESVFQGIVLKLDKEVIYIPDFDKNYYEYVVRDANVLTANGNSLFYFDSKGNLFTYNLLLKKIKFLGKTELDPNSSDLKMQYFYPWRRLVIFDKAKVWSVWYDADLINDAISGYYPNLWIDSPKCLSGIVEKFEFCIENNSVVAYKNTSLW